MNRASLPIGVFDSGLGGLTVVKELRRLLPQENVIYVGDTARVPYGTKSPDTIRRYAMQIAFFLLQKKVKALVVACNSATAAALGTLKDLPVPVIGVIEPGAKTAVLTSKTMKIGVIGTRATIASRAYDKAIHAYAPKAKIFDQACPLLVPLVEEGWTIHPITQLVVHGYMENLKKAKIDTLVLGCTHYPLLKAALQRSIGPKVKLIDSGEETAKTVRDVLVKEKLLNPGKKSGAPVYYVTDNPDSFVRLGRRFLGNGIITRAKRLSLDTVS
jgi:glutamate racemase